MRLGAHIGTSDGLAEAVTTAQSIGCESMQIFSKSPRMWNGPPIVNEAAERFRAAVATQGIRPNAIHHGYLINLASPKPPMLRQSRVVFVDEIQRAAKLGVDYLIFHPGAHMGSGTDAGVKTLVESLNTAFEKTPDVKVRTLIENAAGQGTAMCSSFEEIERALAGVTDRARIGVALDTCHLFAAGFEFRTPESYGALKDRLARSVGLENIFAFHLNDAKADLGSHLDRHENIGKGLLGLDGFRGLLNDPQWTAAPGYLETPFTDEEYGAYRRDLAALRSITKGASAPKAAPAPPRATGKKAGSAALRKPTK